MLENNATSISFEDINSESCVSQNKGVRLFCQADCVDYAFTPLNCGLNSEMVKKLLSY